MDLDDDKEVDDFETTEDLPGHLHEDDFAPVD